MYGLSDLLNGRQRVHAIRRLLAITHRILSKETLLKSPNSQVSTPATPSLGSLNKKQKTVFGINSKHGSPSIK